MGTKRWMDVSPKDTFFRSILEVDNIYLDHSRETRLISPKLYNKFIAGKPRQVHNFTSKEGQTEFTIKGYKPDSRETVVVYLDNVPYPPSKLAKDKVTIGFPMSGGRNVSVYLSGVAEMHKGDHRDNNCQTYPLRDTCKLAYPSKTLKMSKTYLFDTRYSLNEVCVVLGKKLRRVDANLRNGESAQTALTRTIGNQDDCFTIIKGVLYVSYNLNGFPAYVNYNYKAGSIIKNRQKEPIVPFSKCAVYQDRYFPSITVPRSEFFVTLNRMRQNFYERYTDRGYSMNAVTNTQRKIADKNSLAGKWYEKDVVNILDEKFNDGCYVFPLYEDDTFRPEVCVTRAEAVVYLHRFTEWALERFR